MIYLIYGNQDLMVNKQLKKIVSDRLQGNVNEINYRNFDARQTLVQEIMDECQYVPFGYERKVVVIDHAYFLQKGTTKVKNEKKQNFDSLERYLKHPYDDIDLIVCVRSLDVNETNKIYKLLVASAKVFALADVTDAEWPVYVQRYFTNNLKCQISREAIDELGERINYDLASFINEAEKLSSYTNNVTLDDVKLLTPKPLDNDIFLMINSLISGDKETCIRIYQDINKSGGDSEPVRLLMLIATQLRVLCEVVYLKNDGMNSSMIASNLRLNEYRVKKIIEKARYVQIENIYKALDDLYELDHKIKNRLIDGSYGLELFLLSTNFR